MKLIYIAGPYRSKNDSDEEVEANVAAANEVAKNVVIIFGKCRVFPIVPHACTYGIKNVTGFIDGSNQRPITDAYWLDGTMDLMTKCDAVLLTSPDAPQLSEGVRKEVEMAYHRNIPVFKSLEELGLYLAKTGAW